MTVAVAFTLRLIWHVQFVEFHNPFGIVKCLEEFCGP